MSLFHIYFFTIFNVAGRTIDMRKIAILLFLCFLTFLSIPKTHAANAIDFEKLFNEHLSVMLIIHPETGDIYYANQAAVDFYGYPRETLLSMTVDDINTLTPEEIYSERQKAFVEARNFFVFKHRVASGEIRTVYVHSYPIEIGEETYLYSIVVDETTYLAQQDTERLLNYLIIGILAMGIVVTLTIVTMFTKKNKALRESEERFKALHNASFGGIAIHDQGIIIACNQGLSDLSGYTKDELIGMDGLLLLEERQREFVKYQIQTGYEKSYESLGIRKNGEVFPVRIEAKNIIYKNKKVRVTEFRDITEIKQQEAKNLLLEKQWGELIEKMPLGFNLRELIYDDKGYAIDYRFLHANDYYEVITGLRKQDIIGKTAKEIIPDIEPSWIENYAQVLKTGQTQTFEDYSRALGKYYRVVTYPLKDNQFVVIAEDITLRKEYQDKILYASQHDFLTKLPNRRYLDEKMKSLNHAMYYPLIISMVDIDGLKLINDTYGHIAGDEVIIKISEVLTKYWEHDGFVARIGGDEFMIISPQTTIETFKLKRDVVLEELTHMRVNDIPVSLSFGVAVKTTNSDMIEDIIVKAENDMYSKKTLHNQSSRNQVITALFNSLKEKYNEERVHSDRVSQYCLAMGKKMNLTYSEVLELELAGRMHDIGKITIPDHILKKPGKLTEDEWQVMKSHTTNGYQILRSADKYSRLADYALTHHERWDGKGYPKGLKQEEIPFFSRIIGICDAYEAMTSDRPYRKAMSKEYAISELKNCSGLQFDPHLVKIFIEEVLVEDEVTKDSLVEAYSL
jgi:diguanylate cyclase (GGDEF)-like protein/PAS domain S-box-containing protein